MLSSAQHVPGQIFLCVCMCVHNFITKTFISPFASLSQARRHTVTVRMCSYELWMFVYACQSAYLVLFYLIFTKNSSIHTTPTTSRTATGYVRILMLINTTLPKVKWTNGSQSVITKTNVIPTFLNTSHSHCIRQLVLTNDMTIVLRRSFWFGVTLLSRPVLTLTVS